MTGRSINSECSSLGKSVSLPVRDITDSVTGRSKNSECSSLAIICITSGPCHHRLRDRSAEKFRMFITVKSVSLPVRDVTDSMTGWPKNSEYSSLGKFVSLPARAVTDSMTGRSKIYVSLPLGKSVSLPARASYPYTRGYPHRHPSSAATPVPTGVTLLPFGTPAH